MGLFILGIFCTRSSTKAATIAFIISAIFSCTLWIWNYIDDPFKGNYLPTNTTVEGCRGIFDGNITLRPQITAYNPHYGKRYLLLKSILIAFVSIIRRSKSFLFGSHIVIYIAICRNGDGDFNCLSVELHTWIESTGRGFCI